MDMQTYLPPEEVQQIQNIIAVISDPKKYQKAMDELTTKHDKLIDQMQTTKVLSANIQAAQSALDKSKEDLVSKQAQLESSKTWIKQETDRLAQVANDLSKKSLSLDETLKNLVLRSAELDSRELGVQQKEAVAQSKQNTADANLEDSKRLKALVDAKLAKLMELANG